MKIIKARGPFEEGFSVFLSGSVAGDDWRAGLVNRLKEHDIIFLDPRSDDYSSLKMTADDPTFREQVEWEVNGLEQASLIAMYFNHDSAAPITLLEFGLFARSGRLIVRCPKEYKHKAHVDALCIRFGIEQVGTLDELASGILTRYSKTGRK
ncbi:MAG: hypothetical protein DPW18_07225 [Chloroflexi bacterium]|nr:hypothetical protein [Chloroflexota bacterium]MDL1942351.1 hypothetical protein [Chloroflexi bacterium CFX2]